MLNSTFELISLAASNSLMVFCFFNLIIAVLLVGSSKPNSQTNDQSHKVVPANFNVENTKRNLVSLSEKVSSALVEGLEAGGVSSASTTMTNNVETSPDEEDETDENEDEDDLKRRVEEFIQKINKGWRDEKVNTLLHSSAQ